MQDDFPECAVSWEVLSQPQLGLQFQRVQEESVEDRNCSPAETAMNQGEKAGEVEFKNLEFQRFFFSETQQGMQTVLWMIPDVFKCRRDSIMQGNFLMLSEMREELLAKMEFRSGASVLDDVCLEKSQRDMELTEQW